MKKRKQGAASTTALERLAERCGIEAEFQDARGETKRTSSATRLALLQAMGLNVRDEATARAALDQMDAQEWSRVVQPVYVLHQSDDPMRLSITLPRATGEFQWKIRTEKDGDREGSSDFSTLPLAANSAAKPDVERRYWTVPRELPCGYHDLTLQGSHHCTLIVAPPRCWLPQSVEAEKRLWGLSAQVYLLRSGQNWGIGDYTDLKQLIELLAPMGADVVGVNPLHALFLDDPEQASPYSPASRLLLNVLNIDVAEIARQTPGFDLQARLGERSTAQLLAQCRGSVLVDYSGVAKLKLEILEALFNAWLKEPGTKRWHAFDEFRRRAGERFERDITFLTLREHFAKSARPDWRTWPAAFQNPRSPAVGQFAAEHQDRMTFHAWLQFCADAQLAEAARAASGMAVGLYRDLAVGADSSGAETWGNQAAVLATVHVGAPPDIYNPGGQDWGLPPFNPQALQQEAYASFISLIRANMRHAGGLRIDHVMALQHLYWIPAGSPASDGAYVRYPLADLIGILKLESARQRCLIVGEDLGTVPEGFRERMAEANILSYRVLFFEKDATEFLAAARYPRLAVAVAGSHDLPTLRAWWTGADLDLKEHLALYPRVDQAGEARALREQDRQALSAALRAQGLTGLATGGEELFEAVHAHLARTPCALAMVQLDDITGEEDPVNVPTTSTEHANWRRKFSQDLAAIRSMGRLERVATLFNALRK